MTNQSPLTNYPILNVIKIPSQGIPGQDHAQQKIDKQQNYAEAKVGCFST